MTNQNTLVADSPEPIVNRAVRNVQKKYNSSLTNYKSIVNGEQAYNGKEAKAKAQEKSAKAKGISNCPLCAIGHNANAKRIYKKRNGC